MPQVPRCAGTPPPCRSEKQRVTFAKLIWCPVLYLVTGLLQSLHVSASAPAASALLPQSVCLPYLPDPTGRQAAPLCPAAKP